jgi:hypothetical protein
MNPNTYRPTWDVTYNGLPLSSSAYKVHLLMLKEYRAGRVPQAPSEYPEVAFHHAQVAIGQAGIVHCPTCTSQKRYLEATGDKVSPSTPFHWCEYKLTQYGEIYAGQRGII